MSVREYIGARYVPLFMGDWNNGISYEPLSIVQYQGNSYTSRQYVPIGVDINNEIYWAETGNYNAQVETYREEVLTFDSRIKALENNSIEPMYIKMFDGSGSNNITCKIIQCDGATVMIDTGSVNDAQSILNWLNSNGVDKLDALVITHYHEDHYENYNSIITNKCNSNTKIFVQMQPTISNNQISYYNTYSGNVENLLNTLGYESITPTTEGTEYIFGDNDKLKMYVYNVTQSNRAIYDASWGQGGITYYPGAENEGKSTLNNYSLVTRFECGSSSYVDTGDIEGEAQKRLAQYMKPCTVALNPHHFYNNMGYEEFYDRLMPKMWLVSNHFAIEQGEPAYTTLDTYRFGTCYLGRYVKFNFDKINIITNMNSNVDISLMNGYVVNFNGNIIDQDYNSDDGGTTVPRYTCMLPPSVYNDNPYLIIDEAFTLEYLYSIVRKYYNYAANPIGFYIPAANSNVYGANTPFANAVRALWEPLNVTNEIYMWLDNAMRWNFEFLGVQSPYNSLKVFAPTGNTPANVAWNYETKGKLNQAIEGEFADGSRLPSDDPMYNYIMRSTIIAVKTTTGIRIPLLRESEYNSNGQKSYFQGSVIDTTGAYLINVFIYEDGSIHIKRITIADGTINTDIFKIGKIWTIC